jgi:hypothetical protein
MEMLVLILVLTNVLTGIALASYIADAVHDKSTAEIERANLADWQQRLDREWGMLHDERAKIRKGGKFQPVNRIARMKPR